ncbi:hypothetical protein GCM10011348_13980 [Marinobacterium nitratireducens]|uniref:Uncharacterized protein n=1 Tax=Marinobacterium nitratireducens TaxID=518897 RepID=A0A917ZD14_9GAMM|nr:hypothetical protein GCM10011348_13980 [Marinobacterium nitratireducens]
MLLAHLAGFCSSRGRRSQQLQLPGVGVQPGLNRRVATEIRAVKHEPDRALEMSKESLKELQIKRCSWRLLAQEPELTGAPGVNIKLVTGRLIQGAREVAQAAPEQGSALFAHCALQRVESVFAPALKRWGLRPLAEARLELGRAQLPLLQQARETACRELNPELILHPIKNAISLPETTGLETGLARCREQMAQQRLFLPSVKTATRARLAPPRPDIHSRPAAGNKGLVGRNDSRRAETGLPRRFNHGTTINSQLNRFAAAFV